MKWIMIPILILGLIACDAPENFKGIVAYKGSKMPDSGVVIIRLERPEEDYQATSNDGRYEFEFIVGYPTDEDFIFYQKGYIPVKKKLKEGVISDTVFMESELDRSVERMLGK
jgi:hypothetical protein